MYERYEPVFLVIVSVGAEKASIFPVSKTDCMNPDRFRVSLGSGFACSICFFIGRQSESGRDITYFFEECKTEFVNDRFNLGFDNIRAVSFR